MRRIEIDEDIYQHLCRHTQDIGESASSILRRLLNLPAGTGSTKVSEPPAVEPKQPEKAETISEA
jgi:negative modulator of initiation of replication